MLQPDDRFDIQVIGRLVHQQHIRPSQQHPRQRHAHLPAAGQRAHVAIDLVVFKAQPMQHFARLRLQRVAAQMLVLFLHLAEALQNAIHLVRALGIFHGALQRFQLMMQIARAAAARDRLIQHRPALHLLHVLPEIADVQPLGNRDLAFVGLLFADDHAEERRLARAVGANQADLLAGVQLKRSVDKNQLLAVLLIDIGKRNHASLKNIRVLLFRSAGERRGSALAALKSRPQACGDSQRQQQKSRAQEGARIGPAWSHKANWREAG